ncbi:hypothetical protein HOLleu_02506 [Holothuria leucospilota]|uniref:MD-2-related lipid-recognition domain-containing protein n=1 Tax=Holothuria leucospilota TaxID=206669 RepID=A0A9Q1HLG3_HOLLE|nr:hypothetical protein HOLleu_02506 [Holothuria leucospilota]
MKAFSLVLVLTFMWRSAKSFSLGISPADEAVVYGNVAAKPCKYSLSGKWANTTEVSVSPNPPKPNQPVKLHLKFTALDDVWFGNVRGNITRLEDKWVYLFDKAVCGTKGLCPIRKGDTREYNETFPSPSTFVRSGTYRAWAVIVNQDDELIYDLTLYDCPL